MMQQISNECQLKYDYKINKDIKYFYKEDKWYMVDQQDFTEKVNTIKTHKQFFPPIETHNNSIRYVFQKDKNIISLKDLLHQKRNNNLKFTRCQLLELTIKICERINSYFEVEQSNHGNLISENVLIQSEFRLNHNRSFKDDHKVEIFFINPISNDRKKDTDLIKYILEFLQDYDTKFPKPKDIDDKNNEKIMNLNTRLSNQQRNDFILKYLNDIKQLVDKLKTENNQIKNIIDQLNVIKNKYFCEKHKRINFLRKQCTNCIATPLNIEEKFENIFDDAIKKVKISVYNDLQKLDFIKPAMEEWILQELFKQYHEQSKPTLNMYKDILLLNQTEKQKEYNERFLVFLKDKDSKSDEESFIQSIIDEYQRKINEMIKQKIINTQKYFQQQQEENLKKKLQKFNSFFSDQDQYEKFGKELLKNDKQKLNFNYFEDQVIKYLKQQYNSYEIQSFDDIQNILDVNVYEQIDIDISGQNQKLIDTYINSKMKEYDEFVDNFKE